MRSSNLQSLCTLRMFIAAGAVCEDREEAKAIRFQVVPSLVLDIAAGRVEMVLVLSNS